MRKEKDSEPQYMYPSSGMVTMRDASAESVQNTRRVERTLSLIKFMQEFRTVKEIADMLGIRQQNAYRYLNLLAKFGFKIQVKCGRKYGYRIENTAEWFGLIS